MAKKKRKLTRFNSWLDEIEETAPKLFEKYEEEYRKSINQQIERRRKNVNRANNSLHEAANKIDIKNGQ